MGFLPAISPEAVRELREEIRSWNLSSLGHLDQGQIAKMFNAKIQGWIPVKRARQLRGLNTNAG